MKLSPLSKLLAKWCMICLHNVHCCGTPRVQFEFASRYRVTDSMLTHAIPMNCVKRSSCVMLAWIVTLNTPSLALAQQQPRDKLEIAWIEPHVGQVLPLSAEFTEHNGKNSA